METNGTKIERAHRGGVWDVLVDGKVAGHFHRTGAKFDAYPVGEPVVRNLDRATAISVLETHHHAKTTKTIGDPFAGLS